MKKVLVTGGAGFLGAHLCRRLLDDGCSVTCIDDLSTGSLDNIADLSNDRWIDEWRYIVEDVTAIANEDEGYDEIYNLACPASPVTYQRDPIGTMRTCVEGAFTVLDLAYSAGAKVLQASTSEVYGDPQVHPQTEDYWGNVNPIGPRSCYDEGKRCAESLFFDYHRQHGTRIKVARIFNTYGPGMAQDDGRVVSNFIMQALRGEPITIYGDGKQTRSFCYIDDMVEGLVRLMATDDDFTGPVNLGNAAEVTIIDLARRIMNATKSSVDIQLEPLPQDDPKNRCPDRSLAYEAFGWEPTIWLDEGLDRTIEWFRENYA